MKIQIHVLALTKSMDLVVFNLDIDKLLGDCAKAQDELGLFFYAVPLIALNWPSVFQKYPVSEDLYYLYFLYMSANHISHTSKITYLLRSPRNSKASSLRLSRMGFVNGPRQIIFFGSSIFLVILRETPFGESNAFQNKWLQFACTNRCTSFTGITVKAPTKMSLLVSAGRNGSVEHPACGYPIGTNKTSRPMRLPGLDSDGDQVAHQAEPKAGATHHHQHQKIGNCSQLKDLTNKYIMGNENHADKNLWDINPQHGQLWYARMSYSKKTEYLQKGCQARI